MYQHALPTINKLKTCDHYRTINRYRVIIFGLIINIMLTIAMMMWAHTTKAAEG